MSEASIAIERILHVKKGASLSHGLLTMRTPVCEIPGGPWKTEIECKLFALRPIIIHGEDAFQSLLMAIKLIRDTIKREADSGVIYYWMNERDEGGFRCLVE